MCCGGPAILLPAAELAREAAQACGSAVWWTLLHCTTHTGRALHISDPHRGTKISDYAVCWLIRFSKCLNPVLCMNDSYTTSQKIGCFCRVLVFNLTFLCRYFPITGGISIALSLASLMSFAIAIQSNRGICQR